MPSGKRLNYGGGYISPPFLGYQSFKSQFGDKENKVHSLQKNVKEIRVYSTPVARDIARSLLYKRGFYGFTDFYFPSGNEKYALAFSVKKPRAKKRVKRQVPKVEVI